MKFPKTFGERLKALRRERGLSQRELESACGFSWSLLSKFEKGERRPLERHRTALAQALQLTETQLWEGTDLHCSPGPPPDWVDRRCGVEWRRPEWTVERRFASTQKSYAWPCAEAVAQISKNPAREPLSVLFRDIWVDSNLETIYWLRLAGQASPHWLAPLECNFRLHPVVCPRTGQSWGDLPHPCLITEKPFRAIFFPQVTLLVNGHAHRPDCLVCWGEEWSIIEIDGKGHDSTNDSQRDAERRMPVLRLDTAAALSGDLWGAI